MKIGAGVKLDGVRPEIVLGLMVARDVYERVGRILTVTSVMRPVIALGVKSKSLHPRGLAADLRLPSRCDPLPGEAPAPVHDEHVCTMLREALGAAYDVVHEPSAPGGAHIHLEFDP